MPHPRRPVLLLLALVVCFASPAAGSWWDHYFKADEALNRHRWEEAVTELSQAIGERPDSVLRAKTYGTFFSSYFPYLKLGIAYYNLGRYRAALEAFDTEERFGEVARSPSDLQNLQTFRKLAQEAEAAGTASRERERVRALVASSLVEARTLEQAGSLDQAMVVYGSVLALDPANAAAASSMERLRTEATARARAQELEARVAALLSEGSDQMAAGRYAEASARLSQALQLRPDPRVEAMLSEAQAKLRQATGAVLPPLAADLAEVERLEGSGNIAEALTRLQSVLAHEPSNQRALQLEMRLMRSQQEREVRRSRLEEVTRLLDEGAAQLRNGVYEQAASTFNRIIALEPANAVARSQVAEAFKLLSRDLLAHQRPLRSTVPPYLAISNVPKVTGGRDTAQGELAAAQEEVSSPEFSLSGIILDDQPAVTARFFAEESSGTAAKAAYQSGQISLKGRRGEGEAFYRFSFSLPFRLRRGVTELRVVVLDTDNLSSEGVYRVRYLRPWYRSSWTEAGFVLLLGVAGGAVLGYRVRRRNQLLRRQFNPFIAGAPVLDDSLFFGREALIARVLQTVHNNSILLYGPRRIGKTSVQHQLKKRLEQLEDPDYQFYPVFIDLQGTPQERFFATLAGEIFNELAPILAEARPGLRLPEGEPYPYDAFVRDIRDVLRVLRERSAKRAKLVLLIDEIDELNAYDPRVNQKLRSLFMKSFAEDLVAVVSGVGIKKHWESEGSPWYNFFEEIEVKPFTHEDAVALIERPIRGVFTLGTGVVDRIVELTECKPYLIQKLCVALINRSYEQGRRRITVADVDALGRPEEV